MLHSYRFMIDKKIVIAVLVAATAFIAVYNHHSYQSPKEDEVVGDLDMTCGFTSDFGAFLKKSKKKNQFRLLFVGFRQKRS